MVVGSPAGKAKGLLCLRVLVNVPGCGHEVQACAAAKAEANATRLEMYMIG